jgi:hypothetical protein
MSSLLTGVSQLRTSILQMSTDVAVLSQGEVLESEFALQPEARSGGREQGVQQAKHRGRLA